MRLISKTISKIIIEVHIKEIETIGFENLWDKIREVYDVEKYKIFNIDKDKDKILYYIELIPN